MKVTGGKIGGPATAKAEGAKSSAKPDAVGGAKKDAKAGATSSVQDRSNVNVSERAQMMAKAKDVATSTPDVDEAKVARLQKMIDEGSYRVDSDKIADKLLDEHMLIPD